MKFLRNQITNQEFKMADLHTSEITLRVGLDENRIPEESLKIDLWTKDMPVDEMKTFFHQTLVSLSETFLKATQDEKMTATMKDFCDYFAENLNLKE